MTLYFFWMLLSSGLGVLKFLILAKTLVPEDFGRYVTLFSIAAFSSTILSFGLIEGTYKRYPRLWVSGQTKAILQNAKAVALKLSARFIIVTTTLSSLAALFSLQYSPYDSAVAGAVGLFTAGLSLAASLLRSADSPKIMQHFMFNRSLFTFIFALGGSVFYGWRGALFGDALAGFVAIILAYFNVKSAFEKQPFEDTNLDDVARSGSDTLAGEKVFVSNLLSTSTSSTDRAFINSALGPSAAGTYGVIALIFQVGQVFVSIAVQRFGSHIVKNAYIGNKEERKTSDTKLLLLILVLIAIGLIGIALGLKAVDFPSGFFAKYSISSPLIVISGLIATMQIYGYLEFHLLAKDRENDVLVASLASAIAFFALFGVASELELPLEWFVSFVLVAKAIQVALLGLSLIRVESRST